MSQLSQLRARLTQIAGDAKNTAANLASFRSKFQRAISEVQASIGGTAQRTDKEIIQALQAAEREVNQAVEALSHASATARDYAARL